MRFKPQLPFPDADVDSYLESELSKCQIKSHPQRQVQKGFSTSENLYYLGI